VAEPSPAPARLMDTAEFLIAERGMSVSLREIAAQAGQRNNSAVIYHFGNFDGLIKATLERRMLALERCRLQLLGDLDAAGSESTLDDLVAIIVNPALEVPYAQGATHYARFVEQVRHHPVISNAVPSNESWPAMKSILLRLRHMLPESDRRTQVRRIHMMATTLFALTADYERRGELDTTRGRRRASTELRSVLVAVLMAPLPAT
jgi:AcrR family transcriptional regulator